MFERMEFCPKCNGIRKMSVSLGMMPIADNGGPDVVLVYYFQCTACNSYIGSKAVDFEESNTAAKVSELSMPVVV